MTGLGLGENAREEESTENSSSLISKQPSLARNQAVDKAELDSLAKLWWLCKLTAGCTKSFVNMLELKLNAESLLPIATTIDWVGNWKVRCLTLQVTHYLNFSRARFFEMRLTPSTIERWAVRVIWRHWCSSGNEWELSKEFPVELRKERTSTPFEISWRGLDFILCLVAYVKDANIPTEWRSLSCSTSSNMSNKALAGHQAVRKTWYWKRLAILEFMYVEIRFMSIELLKNIRI